MLIRFSQRVALLDEQTDAFLKLLAQLGGYCTVDQAHSLGLGSSRRRAFERLEGLRKMSFLRRVSAYPAVYQITKSVARLRGTDLKARRRHSLAMVRTRILGVAFYLEALSWPCEFVFDHAQKIAAFEQAGCPAEALPERGGRPYLWEDFVIKTGAHRLCVAAVDRAHNSAHLQTWHFVKRYVRCLQCAPGKVSLLLAVQHASRCRAYGRAIKHPEVQKYASKGEISVRPYQVQPPVPFIHLITTDEQSCEPSETRRKQ